jgi:hypothetical protein
MPISGNNTDERKFAGKRYLNVSISYFPKTHLCFMQRVKNLKQSFAFGKSVKTVNFF